MGRWEEQAGGSWLVTRAPGGVSSKLKSSKVQEFKVKGKMQKAKWKMEKYNAKIKSEGEGLG
jgi:hypothetical protein